MNESEILLNILTDVTKDITESSGLDAMEAFQAYRRSLKPLVEPYVQDGALDNDKAKLRFFSETAVLHTAVSLISQWCAIHTCQVERTGSYWDIHEESRFFSWYRVPPQLLDRTRNWTSAQSDVEDLIQAVSLLAETSLVGLRRHSLGEFFTPRSIARHLIDLADYDPPMILNTKTVDPACGSGNLLVAIVRRVTQAVQSGVLNPARAISALNSNTCGFDVQPFAVLLTRLQLLLASLPILESFDASGKSLYELLSFPGIQWRDPLRDPGDLWDDFAHFDVVVSNPPFLKVSKGRIPFVKMYEQVLYGHVNLYQLFLWWAIRATQPNGRLVFLLPQSVRSGQYPNRLRQKVTETCDLVAVTSFVNRKGVFDSVEQPMMAVALSKSLSQSNEAWVNVLMSANGETLDRVPSVSMPQSQVIWTRGDVSIWCVSNREVDYRILTKTSQGCVTLGNVDAFEILNGGLVWNRNTEKLKPEQDDYALPLISSASIGVHRFIFPPSDERVAGRLFVDATPPAPGPVYEGSSILLKRTTPKIMGGRRIVATMPGDGFLRRYGGYFAENHVNVVVALDIDAQSYDLLGLCAWLNSRLANFIFGMINVSSHLSKFDLSLIPVPVSLLAELGELARCLTDDPTMEKRQTALGQIDETVSSFFGLSTEESQRVRQAVPSI